MPNFEHIDMLKRRPSEWARWRQLHNERPLLTRANLTDARLRQMDLSDADLTEATLISADLRGANLRGASLQGANLSLASLDGAMLQGADLKGAKLGGTGLDGADLSEANLEDVFVSMVTARRANFCGANLRYVNLGDCDFSEANLSGADLFNAKVGRAEMRGADLSRANLSESVFVGTRLSNANLSGARVYGVAAWDVELEGATQSNLIITPAYESEVTVDNLEVAQFIYLLLNNKNIRSLIDTVTSKVVLILGRFTVDRKAVLDELRAALRVRGYSPILFDFERPSSRDLTETISTLAGLARFIIADITDAKSIPQELQAIVPNYPSVPVQPVLLAAESEYGMFERFRRFPWVLPVVLYESPVELLARLEADVIAPAERMLLLRPPS
jgi:uncharacterized protein YjbI with pentapeptide repeats